MRKVAAVLMGNFLEFYDFTLFAALLPIISPILFPSPEILASFTSGYLLLAVGFFARPIGAVLFGYIGDKYTRRKALIFSISLMAFATLMMGLLPTSETIGAYAIVLLVFCRILQGLSAGGEYSGAGLMLTEHVAKENQYLNGAILTSSGVMGAFVASLVAAIISMALFPKESWRILFLIGGGIGFINLWLRLSTAETGETSRVAEGQLPWSMLLRDYKLSLFCTIAIGGLMNVPFYLITGFINTYFVATGMFAKTTLMVVNAFVILSCALMIMLFGFLSKRINPLKMMFYASFGMAAFSFPFFFLVESGVFEYFLVAELMMVFLLQIFVAPAFVTMAQLFPYRLRYRGLAIGNCLGLAFLGGSTPYISANLVRYTELSWSPAFYLFAVSALGFFAVCIVANTRKKAVKAGLTDSLQGGMDPVMGVA